MHVTVVELCVRFFFTCCSLIQKMSLSRGIVVLMPMDQCLVIDWIGVICTLQKLLHQASAKKLHMEHVVETKEARPSQVRESLGR